MGYVDNFNPRGVAPRENSGRMVYPDGDYKVVVNSIDEKINDNGMFLLVKMTFIGGEFADRELVDFMAVGSNDPARRERGEAALAELMRSLDYDDGAGTNDLLNMPLKVALSSYVGKKDKKTYQNIAYLPPVAESKPQAAQPKRAAPKTAHPKDEEYTARKAANDPPEDGNETVPF